MRLRSRLFLPLLLTGLIVFIFSGILTPVQAGKGEKSKGAFLGVFLEELEQDDREALDFEGKGGILVSSLVDDGPAEECGIESGDIITELDGEKIASIENLRKVLAKHEPGDKIRAVVFRDGKKEKFKVKLGKKPRMEKTISAIPKIKALRKHYIFSENRAYLGVEIETLEGQLAEYFDVKAGVLIESVGDETPAQKAGFKAGDVIVKAGENEITDETVLLKVLGEFKPEDEVKFKVKRKGKEMTLTAKLAERPCESYSCGDCDEHRQILIDRDGEIIDLDLDDIGDVIHGALKDIDIDIEMMDFKEDFEEFREELERLREDMEKLKEQLKEK